METSIGDARTSIEQRLAGPDFPYELLPLWEMWIELQGYRPSTGFGYGLLGAETIEAHGRMVGICLSPWEIGTLKAADFAWLGVIATQQQSRKKE